MTVGIGRLEFVWLGWRATPHGWVRWYGRKGWVTFPETAR
jgi:hypothetical protein